MITLIAMMSAVVGVQAGSVKGKVRDENRSPVAGAVAQIRSLKKGDYTEKDGRFEIRDVPPGTYELEVTLLEYKAEKRTIVVKKDEDLTVDVRISPQAVTTQSVEVRAQRKRQEQTDTRTSVITVDPQEAKTKAGAIEDVFRTLQTMPGVVAPNDFSSQLVIRGSGPDQNLILMDNIELFNPYRLYGFISLFNPETVNGITLLTGGFGARYSDRLSAVLDITNRDGYRDRGPITGKLHMSLTNANLVLDGAIPFWNGSWVVSTRRTYYDLIAGPIARSLGAVDGDVAFPNFRDLQVKVTVYPMTDHKITLNALTSRDNTMFESGQNRDRVDSVSITDNSFNDVFGVSWLWLASKAYTMSTVVSTYSNTGATSFGGLG
ncbi:MAG: carboxypeptidase-like regulatory domain-containing protein, partial [Candidatus Kapaibacterium sp.]